MANNQAFVNQLAGNNANESVPIWNEEKCIGDAPTSNGKLIEKNILQKGHKMMRNGVSLATNFTGNDPGVGGAGGAVVQTAMGDRNNATKCWFQSMCVDGSNIGNELSDAAVFTTGHQVWLYITTTAPVTGASILYLPPTTEEVREHKRWVEGLSYQHLPVAKQNNMLVHHFKSMIQAHNPKEHPSFVLTELEMIRIWANGLHPHAKQYAMQLVNSNLADAQSYARLNRCVHPVNFPAHHPNAGNAHPDAGNLSFQLCATHVHNKFTTELSAGIFALKAQPAINLSEAVSESPGPSQDANAFLFASWRECWDAGYDSMAQYSINVLQRELGMRTCRNCGGVNHFSHKDGVLICPTVEGSVPVSLLRDIKYPVAVRPWRFSVGGKGKGGKGKGKGGKDKGGGGRGGGGRGTFYNDWFSDEWEAYYYYGGDQNEDTTAAAPTAAEEPPADVSEAQYFINDDFSGWNE